VKASDLVAHASDPAFSLSPDLKVLAWNQRAQDLLGYSPDEVRGRSCHEVIQGVLPGGIPLCTPDCPARLCFGQCLPFQARYCLVPRKDGQRVRVALSTIALPEPDEDGARAVVLMHPLEEDLHPPAPLRIFTLGRFALAVGDRPVPLERWHRKQALTLLKVLVTFRGQAVHRERLMEALWPEAGEAEARNRLKVTLHALRHGLREAGVTSEVVGTAGESYFLRREAVWVDVEAFEALAHSGETLARQGQPEQAITRLEEARALYRGDYLPEDLYAGWCAEERERLREIFLGAMEHLADLYARQGRLEQAISTARDVLAHEPLRESLHRALMDYLLQAGRPDEALAQYQACARVLARQLGVRPSPSTRRLYRRILQSSASG